MKNYGLALKNLRTYFTMTQREIAERIGVSNHAISKWENGVNQPDLDTIRVICDIFGVTVEQFFRVASGESVERVLKKPFVSEEAAFTEEEYKNTPSMGAGMRSNDSFSIKWWTVLLIFCLVAFLTAGIILLALSEKGDVIPARPQSSESIESSSSTGNAVHNCEIRYYVDGALFQTQRVKKGEGATPIEVEKYGHVFQGWYQDAWGSKKFDFSLIKTDINDVHALFTPIAYTVSFTDANEELFSLNLHYGQAWSFPALEHTKEGFVFKGWECDGVLYESKAKGVFLAKKEGDRVEVKAIWTATNVSDYKVIFLTDSGEHIGEERYRYGEAWTLPQCFVEREGYTFDYWDLNGMAYLPGRSFSMREGTEYTFTAVYKPNVFFIHYQYTYEGGSVYEKLVPYTYDAKNYLLSSVFNGVREGYYVSGWRIEDTEYAPDGFIGNLSKIDGETFVATPVWTMGSQDYYTVYFESEEEWGVEYAEPISVAVGEKFTLPTCKGTQIGYTFAYWKHVETGKLYRAGQAFTLDAAKQELFISVWDIMKFEVIYESEYHEESISCIYEGDPYPCLIGVGHSAWKREGYELVGWSIYGEEYALGESLLNLPRMERTIYAKAIWKRVY